MKIAVFGRTASDDNCKALHELCKLMVKFDLQVTVHKDFLKEVTTHSSKILCEYNTFSTSNDLDEIDYMLSIGGDGTLLNTVDFVKNKNIPVIGVNTGRLGFLANFTVDQLGELMQLMKENKFTSDVRSLLEVTSNQSILGENNYALNEFTIQKQDPSAVIKVHVYLNGEFLSSYWADGVIVSTPTGSTGYSLSANGPIIVPQTKSFVITPIAPHNLNLRPIVIPDSAELTLKIGGHRGNAYCTLDSKHWPLKNDVEFTIKKAPFVFNIVRPPENTFIDTLRNKLMWGIDNRNKD